MVALIDQRDLAIAAAQVLDKLQPGKAGPDDDDPMLHGGLLLVASGIVPNVARMRKR